MRSGGEQAAAYHRQPSSTKHAEKMLGSLLVVAVAVASSTGMHFSYDGTPLADGVVIGGAVSPSVPVVGSIPQPAARVVSGPVSVASSRQQTLVPGFASSAFPRTAPVVSPVLPPPAPASPVREGPRGCSYPLGTVVHETFNGREYHLSWCSQPGRTFSFQQAESFCRSIGTVGHPTGFHAVSLETQVEDSFITSIISHYEVPYIWTSGYKVGPYSWKWQSCVASQYSRWSHTGRFGRSQPDNADMNENCLAILNNFYGDGIIWHDIDCSLEKYVICERPSLRAH
ncbi:uncharacterized protein LOC123501400 [Portunus trituberculatus]|uniref:uncharacterized protein LOC123501400 n=1 Tax=Portunus trituberculatus TaxID=210409 RepID=UPI001E1CDA8D|nr:uncharacterized protein LOC123501400 [Portunus trituberculatus]